MDEVTDNKAKAEKVIEESRLTDRCKGNNCMRDELKKSLRQVRRKTQNKLVEEVSC